MALSTYQEVNILILSILASTVVISKSNFDENFATDNGGAIYAISFSQLNINQATKFNRNYAGSFGGDLYLAESVNWVVLDRVSIQNEIAPNSIYLSKVNFRAN